MAAGGRQASTGAMVEGYAGATLVDGYIFLPGVHDLATHHREADSCTTEESRSLPEEEDGASSASPKCPLSPNLDNPSGSTLAATTLEPLEDPSQTSSKESLSVQQGDPRCKERTQSSGSGGTTVGATSFGTCGSNESAPSIPAVHSPEPFPLLNELPLPPLAPLAPGGAPGAPAPLAMAETSLQENLLRLRNAAGEWGKAAQNESAVLAVRLQELGQQTAQQEHARAEIIGSGASAAAAHTSEVECGAGGGISAVSTLKLERTVETKLRGLSIERRARQRLLGLVRCMSRFNRWMDVRLGVDAALAATWAQFAACGLACVLNMAGILTTASLGPAVGITAGILVVGGLLWNSGLLLVRLTDAARD